MVPDSGHKSGNRFGNWSWFADTEIAEVWSCTFKELPGALRMGFGNTEDEPPLQDDPTAKRHRDQTSKLSGFAAVFFLFIRLYVFFGFRRLDPATQFVSFISRAGQERSGAALKVCRNRSRHLSCHWTYLMLPLTLRGYCSI
jgi:hypothetical protein